MFRHHNSGKCSRLRLLTLFAMILMLLGSSLTLTACGGRSEGKAKTEESGKSSKKKKKDSKDDEEGESEKSSKKKKKDSDTDEEETKSKKSKKDKKSDVEDDEESEKSGKDSKDKDSKAKGKSAAADTFTPGPGVMMEGPGQKLEIEYLFGNEEFIMDQVETITFVDSIGIANYTAWDVSMLGDGSVLAWTEETGATTDIYFKATDKREDYPLLNLYIGAEGGVIAPENISQMFGSFGNLKKVTFDGNFDTSHTKNMKFLFFECISLKETDFATLDTKNVETVEGLFWYCHLQDSISLKGMDLSSVKTAQAMFRACRQLEEVDLSGVKMPICESMGGMFLECVSLKKADLTGVDTSACTNMKNMFNGCKKLEDVVGLEIPEDCNTEGMFGDTPLDE